VEENHVVMVEASSLEEEKTDENAVSALSSPIEAKSPKSSTKPHGCSHHFGYLSERPKKDSIPEECMVCDNIVRCMLKVIQP
jgi:hypothetical protein